MLQNIGIGVLGIVVALVLVVYGAGRGCFGDHEAPGVVADSPRSAASVRRVEAAVSEAARDIGVSRPKQVLFGDLHVHTTFSFDAFMFSTPVLAGEGAHPPADACDFARYCSSLDFWSINDHAFSITPEHWQETVDSIRQCNAVAGDQSNPDTVAFLGWEWTQVGTRPENHYGHKNVVLAHTDDARIPRRPIASQRLSGVTPSWLGLGMLALTGGGRWHDFARYTKERSEMVQCEDGVHTRDLPDDCSEVAATPAELFRKLDESGHESIVIPHGTTWGFYTPPASRWDKQLAGDMHDPDRQTLMEIYSGHGDSEVYRDWEPVHVDESGAASCPAPRPDYLPSCWHAGEIVRGRCLDAGESESECEQRAATARQHAVEAGVGIMKTVPGTRASDWLDAGQCRDCDQASFNYRPGGSAQYVLALGNFDDDPSQPRRFRMGFMSSSDNHFARPGTGFKEFSRVGNTESTARERNPDLGPLAGIIGGEIEEPAAHSKPFVIDQPSFDVFETERQMSFLLTGGLIAAHAEGRDRDAIWQAMERREVYGTSGPRILLWFDLLNPPGSRGATLPMGGEVAMGQDPIFQVRAVGSFEQKPGCPDESVDSLSPARLEHLCKGECYHPSDRRRNITRIEIVRIRPQVREGEPVADLISDPWKTLACEPSEEGCVATFTDPDFVASGRDTLYYARVFEEPKPGINASNVRCERDAEGNCLRSDPCPSEDGSNPDCLAPHEPRAWSSPIWVDQLRAGAG